MKYAKITASIGLRFKKDAKVATLKVEGVGDMPQIKIGKEHYYVELRLLKYKGKDKNVLGQWDEFEMDEITHARTVILNEGSFKMKEITNPKDIAKLQPYKPTRKKRS